MNQALIFNDDYIFNEGEGTWQCSIQISGQKVTILLKSKQVNSLRCLTSGVKFDIEDAIECWFETNELDSTMVTIQI